jgi:hypothetical protein
MVMSIWFNVLSGNTAVCSLTRHNPVHMPQEEKVQGNLEEMVQSSC